MELTQPSVRHLRQQWPAAGPSLGAEGGSHPRADLRLRADQVLARRSVPSRPRPAGPQRPPRRSAHPTAAPRRRPGQAPRPRGLASFDRPAGGFAVQPRPVPRPSAAPHPRATPRARHAGGSNDWQPGWSHGRGRNTAQTGPTLVASDTTSCAPGARRRLPARRRHRPSPRAGHPAAAGSPPGTGARRQGPGARVRAPCGGARGPAGESSPGPRAGLSPGTPCGRRRRSGGPRRRSRR